MAIVDNSLMHYVLSILQRVCVLYVSIVLQLIVSLSLSWSA